jgi:hypothetical protein
MGQFKSSFNHRVYMSLILSEIDRLDTLLVDSEQTSMSNLNLNQKIQRLEDNKLRTYLHEHRWLYDVYEASDLLGRVAIASLIAIDQANFLLVDPDEVSSGWKKWHHLIEHLKEIEVFYAPMGGLVGYQRELLYQLGLQLKLTKPHANEEITYSQPPKIDIRNYDYELRCAIAHAIEHWSSIGFMMPVGGAGDRLGLEDEQGKPLPAAFLSFEGYSLLEGLLQDIEAIELLIEELTGHRIFTPIALMTSEEKNNHSLIEKFLKDHQYFGRPISSFRLFKQKLVPMVTEFGQWATEKSLELMFKPGGHGVIWRAAQVEGVFDWFQSLQVSHCIVRQINNPLAGCDYNLLSLAGFGLKSDKTIGFMSCERALHMTEGVNVMRRRHLKDGKIAVALTNIEYTDFAQEGLQDVDDQSKSGGAWSTNTNLFVVSLKAIQEAMLKTPFPGPILNLKSRATVRIGHEMMNVRVARLESMMQNIADVIEDYEDCLNENWSCLKQFLLYNQRLKTISVTKKKSPLEGFAFETTMSAFYDKQRVWRDLLTNECQINIPLLNEPEEYFHYFPPFVIQLHPSLGPLHHLIKEKIFKGTFGLNSYFNVEVRHLLAHDIYLDGAIKIIAHQLQEGYALLQQVSIINAGWSEESYKEFWSAKKVPQYSLEIELEGKSAFIAKQICFEGSRKIIVPDGIMMIAEYNEYGELVLRHEPIDLFEEQKKEFTESFKKWRSLLLKDEAK